LAARPFDFEVLYSVASSAGPGVRIENQYAVVGVVLVAEVEHVPERSRECVERTAPDPRSTPVVLDKRRIEVVSVVL